MAGKGFKALQEGAKSVAQAAVPVAKAGAQVTGGTAKAGAGVAKGTSGAAAGIVGRVLQFIGNTAKTYPKLTFLVAGFGIAKTVQNKLRKRKAENAEMQSAQDASQASQAQAYDTPAGGYAPQEVAQPSGPGAAQSPSPEQEAAMMEQLMSAISQAQTAGVKPGGPETADPSAMMDGNWREQAQVEQQQAAEKEQSR